MRYATSHTSKVSPVRDVDIVTGFTSIYDMESRDLAFQDPTHVVS